jgi:hypothetical protein
MDIRRAPDGLETFLTISRKSQTRTRPMRLEIEREKRRVEDLMLMGSS